MESPALAGFSVCATGEPGLSRAANREGQLHHCRIELQDIPREAFGVAADQQVWAFVFVFGVIGEDATFFLGWHAAVFVSQV